MKKLADAGVEFYELPPDEADRWNALFTEEVVKKWVDRWAKGLPEKKLYSWQIRTISMVCRFGIPRW